MLLIADANIKSKNTGLHKNAIARAATPAGPMVKCGCTNIGQISFCMLMTGFIHSQSLSSKWIRSLFIPAECGFLWLVKRQIQSEIWWASEYTDEWPLIDTNILNTAPSQNILARLTFYIKRNKVTQVTTCLTISTNTRRLPWSLFYWFLGYQHVVAWRRRRKLNQIIAGSEVRLSTGQLSCYAGTTKVSFYQINLWFWMGSIWVKKGFVLTEKLVDKVAASLISNLLQGRKTLSSKISTAVKFIRNQDNFSKYLQQIKVIILLIHPFKNLK